MFSFTSFGVVLILGGLRFATIEVQIYYQAVSIFNLPLAASLSLVQIGAMFAVMLAYTRLQSAAQSAPVKSAFVAHKPRLPREKLIVALIVCFCVAAALHAAAGAGRALLVRRRQPGLQQLPRFDGDIAGVFALHCAARIGR